MDKKAKKEKRHKYKQTKKGKKTKRHKDKKTYRQKYDKCTWSIGRKIGTIGDFSILATESPLTVSLSDQDDRCFGRDDNY